ncbi:MAG: hypothetical protein GX275_06445 [Clostridiales bacterium]|nr:hypothetical protein [Clostridiales bacterium]
MYKLLDSIIDDINTSFPEIKLIYINDTMNSTTLKHKFNSINNSSSTKKYFIYENYIEYNNKALSLINENYNVINIIHKKNEIFISHLFNKPMDISDLSRKEIYSYPVNYLPCILKNLLILFTISEYNLNLFFSIILDNENISINKIL